MSPFEEFLYNFGIPLICFSIGIILLVLSNRSSKSKSSVIGYNHNRLTTQSVSDQDVKSTKSPKV